MLQTQKLSLFCLEEAAKISVYFFHFLSRKTTVGRSNLLKSSLNFPEKYGTVEEQQSTQHSKQIARRDAAFIEKLQPTAASRNDRKQERDLLLHRSQQELCREDWFVFFPLKAEHLNRPTLLTTSQLPAR